MNPHKQIQSSGKLCITSYHLRENPIFTIGETTFFVKLVLPDIS
ncbi:hypothetical protein FACS1894161_5120 [Spirochaetia bacterium]|nr:hypothetical protein FACS1894161_5120 [Spirochaetia bacterium]